MDYDVLLAPPWCPRRPSRPFASSYDVELTVSTCACDVSSRATVWRVHLHRAGMAEFTGICIIEFGAHPQREIINLTHTSGYHILA